MRIQPLSPPYPAPVAEDFARIMPPGHEPLILFRAVAHNPRVLRRMRRGSLLDEGSITAAERELVILRTTARCGCEYEWGVHVAFFAPRVGLGEAQVEATVHGDADDPAWTPAQALLVRLCDQLHERFTLDDELYDALRAEWSDAQRIELVMLAGLYHAVSMMTNALELPLEPGAPRFPPSRRS